MITYYLLFTSRSANQPVMCCVSADISRDSREPDGWMELFKSLGGYVPSPVSSTSQLSLGIMFIESDQTARELRGLQWLYHYDHSSIHHSHTRWGTARERPFTRQFWSYRAGWWWFFQQPHLILLE